MCIYNKYNIYMYDISYIYILYIYINIKIYKYREMYVKKYSCETIKDYITNRKYKNMCNA